MTVNTCTGTLDTWMTYLQLNQHRCFARCEKDLVYFVELLPSPVKVSTWQILNPKYSLAGNYEVVES